MTTEWSIRDLRAADGGAQILLTLENGAGEREQLAIFASRLPAIPQIGAVTDEELLVLRREAQITAAIVLGLRALTACGASRRHLTDKLRARGVRSEIASAAVEELAARGYLNEVQGAEREAERGLCKLWGDRRILAELRAKGYEEETLERVRARLSEENAVERCVRLLHRLHIACPQNENELQKLLSRMVRYGYAPAECKRALRRLYM